MCPSKIVPFKSPALCFRVDRQEDLKKQRVDADFFENGEKSIFFRTKTVACGRRLIISLSVL